MFYSTEKHFPSQKSNCQNGVINHDIFHSLEKSLSIMWNTQTILSGNTLLIHLLEILQQTPSYYQTNLNHNFPDLHAYTSRQMSLRMELKPAYLAFKMMSIIQSLAVSRYSACYSMFQANSKFDENYYCCSSKKTNLITTQFCTYQDSSAVLACAKFCYDQTHLREDMHIGIHGNLIKFEILSKYR